MKKASKIAHNWLIVEAHNNFFLAMLPGLKGVIVDLGCGTMPYRQEILDHGCRYVGVDWPNSVHGVVPDIASDLNAAVDLPDAYADAVMSFSVLEHLHRPARMLEESWRILKPGGSLFIEVPFQWHVHEAPWDYFRFTRHGLERLLQDAGFEEIEVRENGGFWATWVLKFNYQSRRWLRGPRPVRLLIHLLLIPIWFLSQTMARWLDAVDFNPGEAPSYATVARKPLDCRPKQ
jgi:SAM-dependent methyltransferase